MSPKRYMLCAMASISWQTDALPRKPSNTINRLFMHASHGKASIYIFIWCHLESRGVLWKLFKVINPLAIESHENVSSVLSLQRWIRAAESTHTHTQTHIIYICIYTYIYILETEKTSDTFWKMYMDLCCFVLVWSKRPLFDDQGEYGPDWYSTILLSTVRQQWPL